MNIFMIGGTGLLGCEAATQLIKMGHKVTSVALPPLPQGAPIPEEMKIVFGDINKKSDEEIEEMLKGNDVFIYAAGVDERVEFLILLWIIMTSSTTLLLEESSLFAKRSALREQ